MSAKKASFRFVDLFAGIGGFHAALSAMGGECVYAVEKDPQAAAVYERNWKIPAFGDVVADTNPSMLVPDHDVLAAGFPCQPFSKSGFQRGMEEARGTLFWNICQILKVRRPAVVLLENVRNIAGPRHQHEWEVIIASLRELGYRVSSQPIVFSPHFLPPDLGGRPQVRERVFIVGTYVGEELAREQTQPAVQRAGVDGWLPEHWSLAEHLPLDTPNAAEALKLRLSPTELALLDAWNDLITQLREAGVRKLPGFPIWVDDFVLTQDLRIEAGTPLWKAKFKQRNAAFYTEHQILIEAWLERWDYLRSFPPSRRKLEWQAQDAKSLDETVMHLRPSGLRAKKPTYLPALVAITQTSILGDQRRRISPREAARLQGLPEWFDFGDQPAAATYKQLGNGVNVGAAYHVFRQHCRRDLAAIQQCAPGLAASVRKSNPSPDLEVERHWESDRLPPRRERDIQPVSATRKAV